MPSRYGRANPAHRPAATRAALGAGGMPDLKGWARTLRCDVHALYLAGRDPRVAWYAKALGSWKRAPPPIEAVAREVGYEDMASLRRLF